MDRKEIGCVTLGWLHLDYPKSGVLFWTR